MNDIANMEIDRKVFDFAFRPEKAQRGNLKKFGTEQGLKDNFILAKNGNVKLGKVFLLGSDWNGTLDLTDPKKKQLYKNYIGAE